MGNENLIRKTEAQLDGVFADLSPREKKTVLTLARASRHMEILFDSIHLLHSTVSPDTFFSRYRTAIREAWRIMFLFRGEKAAVSAAMKLAELVRGKTKICNDFLNRCSSCGNLPFVQTEIRAHRKEMPAASYVYFRKLLEQHRGENPDGEYTLCSVEFSRGGKVYYYLTDNRSLRRGDCVTVPVGETREEKTARVVKVEVCRGQDIPFPVNRLKYIR